MIHSKTFFQSIRKIITPSVISNFFIYSGGTLLLKSVNLILMPFVLALLTPSEYGLLSLTMSFTTILAVLAGLGLRQTFGIEYFHCNSLQRRRMANDIIILYLVLAIPFFIALLFNLSYVNHYYFVNQATKTLLFISLAYCFMQFFVELFYQLLRYQCRALILTLLQLTVAVTTIALNIVFLYYTNWRITGMLLGYTLGAILAVLIGAYAYVKKDCFAHINIKQSLTKCHYYLRLGLPFIPGMLFNWVLAAGDKWLLARYATLTDVGIYSLADTFGQAYQMLILYPLAGSYLPYLFHQFAAVKNSSTKIQAIEQKNRQLMWLCMLIIFTGIVLGSYIGTPILTWLLPQKYHPAICYIWPLLTGYLLLTGTYFCSALVQFHKKTFFLAFSLLLPTLVNLVLNYFLIPIWGIYGCILATITAYAIYFLSMLWYNAKLIKHYFL